MVIAVSRRKSRASLNWATMNPYNSPAVSSFFPPGSGRGIPAHPLVRQPGARRAPRVFGSCCATQEFYPALFNLMQHCYILIAGLGRALGCISLNVADFKGLRTGHDFGEGQGNESYKTGNKRWETTQHCVLWEFGTNSAQLREKKNGPLAPKRHQMKHLDFLILLLESRRSMSLGKSASRKMANP
jgi:hypothetical protein